MRVVAPLVLVVALTRADAWLSSLTGLPFGSMTAAGALCSLALFALFDRRPLTRPALPFLCIAAFYGGAFLVGAMFGTTAYAVSWSRDAAYAGTVFLVVYAFSSSPERYDAAIRAVVGCGIALALINIAEWFAPGFVHLSHSKGRAAGLLKNANTSAFVLAASYAAIDLRRTRYGLTAQWLLRTLMLTGVAATFSRGGLLMAAVAVVLPLLRRTERIPRVATALALVVLTVTAAIGVRHVGRGDVAKLQAVGKVAEFAGGKVDDNYRLFLARYYFGRFLERPIRGYGFSATTRPSGANGDLSTFFGVKGPHNTPIAILAEFGVLPACAWLLFFLAAFGASANIRNPTQRGAVRALLAVLAMQNLFAHDMPLSRPALALFALVSSAPLALAGGPDPVPETDRAGELPPTAGAPAKTNGLNRDRYAADPHTA